MNLFSGSKQDRKFEKFSLRDGELWLMDNFMPLDKAKFYYDRFYQTYKLETGRNKNVR